MQYPSIMQPTHARIEQVNPEEEASAISANSASFPSVSLKMARNFFVTDTYYERPETGVSQAVYDQTDPADLLSSFRGLSAVSHELRDLLPAECRKAYDVALEVEEKWKRTWGPESKNTSRRQPVIDKAIVPYSMT